MSGQKPPTEPLCIEIEALSPKIWDIVSRIALNLDNDATKFMIAVQLYCENPMDINHLRAVKSGADTILEQREVLFPIIEALSKYLDQHIKDAG